MLNCHRLFFFQSKKNNYIYFTKFASLLSIKNLHNLEISTVNNFFLESKSIFLIFYSSSNFFFNIYFIFRLWFFISYKILNAHKGIIVNVNVGMRGLGQGTFFAQVFFSMQKNVK